MSKNKLKLASVALTTLTAAPAFAQGTEAAGGGSGSAAAIGAAIAIGLAVLGGGHHYQGADYIVAHLRAHEVTQVAAALETVDEAWIRERYDRIDPADYQGFLSDEDFDYTWGWFEEVRDFYGRAAAASRAVIFTVDQ